jgi:hypothetical protein
VAVATFGAGDESVSVTTPDPPALIRAAWPGPRIHLPARDYLLFEAPLAAVPGFGKSVDNQSPNLFWPDDHAWCVATEIDLFCTLVAGPEALADALLSEPRLEAWRVDPGDPVTYDSDLVNV